MKYVVYYDEKIYSRTLNNKLGKEFKKNVQEALGPEAKIIWIVADSTQIFTLV